MTDNGVRAAGPVELARGPLLGLAAGAIAGALFGAVVGLTLPTTGAWERFGLVGNILATALIGAALGGIVGVACGMTTGVLLRLFRGRPLAFLRAVAAAGSGATALLLVPLVAAGGTADALMAALVPAGIAALGAAALAGSITPPREPLPSALGVAPGSERQVGDQT